MSVLIVGIGGSLAESSTSRRALQLALAAASAAGADVQQMDVRELQLPLYDESIEPPLQAVQLADLSHAADALIWSGPTYHGSVSGALKNTLDWLQLLERMDPAFLTDKPVGLISTACGVRAVQAIHALEQTVHALRGWVVPFSLPIGAAHRVFSADGQLLDPAVGQRLAMLGRMTVDSARRFSAPAEAAEDIDSQKSESRDAAPPSYAPPPSPVGPGTGKSAAAA